VLHNIWSGVWDPPRGHFRAVWAAAAARESEYILNDWREFSLDHYKKCKTSLQTNVRK
jgi:hypothetical protein